MSVTNPLLQELKGCTSAFLKNSPVKDTHPSLLQFLICLERILYFNCVPPSTFSNKNDPFSWISKCSHTEELHDILTEAKNNPYLCTKEGQLRWIIKSCLNKQCLHVPLEFLIENKLNMKYYEENSILGDEILSQIFLSVIYQVGKIQFKLDLTNASFLDLTWVLPNVVNVQLVPATSMGLTLSFAAGKAIIIKIKPHSVTSENKSIAVGDVLIALNGVVICNATKNRLKNLLKSCKPIDLTLAKAFKDGILYAPIKDLYRMINLDVDIVNEQRHKEEPSKTLLKRDGYEVTYMGHAFVGKTGDMRLIDNAYHSLLDCKSRKYQKCIFYLGDLGIKCHDVETNEQLLAHSYMEIASCGTVLLMPRYFCYVAGDEFCNTARNFECFFFMANEEETALFILKALGQGFHRTHYAV